MDGNAIKADPSYIREVLSDQSINLPWHPLEFLLKRLSVLEYETKKKCTCLNPIYFIVESRYPEDRVPVILFPGGRLVDPNHVAKYRKKLTRRCPYCSSPKCRKNRVYNGNSGLRFSVYHGYLENLWPPKKGLVATPILSLYPFAEALFADEKRKRVLLSSCYREFVNMQFGYTLGVYKCLKEGKVFICAWPVSTLVMPRTLLQCPMCHAHLQPGRVILSFSQVSVHGECPNCGCDFRLEWSLDSTLTFGEIDEIRNFVKTSPPECLKCGRRVNIDSISMPQLHPPETIAVRYRCRCNPDSSCELQFKESRIPSLTDQLQNTVKRLTELGYQVNREKVGPDFSIPPTVL